MLLDEALPIGTLFKTLSAESRNYVAKQRMSLESVLLRYPGRVQMFKKGRDRNIYVSKPGMAPAYARHGREVAGTAAGQPNVEHGRKTDREKARIYTVLAAIPNEWASFTSLPLTPEQREICAPKKSRDNQRWKRQSVKSWFEARSRYFSVKIDEKHPHTFFVRRSDALQAFMKEKQSRREAELRASGRAPEAAAGAAAAGSAAAHAVAPPSAPLTPAPFSKATMAARPIDEWAQAVDDTAPGRK